MEFRRIKTNPDNPLQDMNPFTHGVLTLVLVLGALLFGWRYVLMEIILVFALALIADVFGDFFRVWIKSALLLTIVVCTLQLLLLPGDEIVWSFGIFTVTDFAANQALTIGARILGVFTPIIYFLQVIQLDEFITMMQQSGVSPQVTYIVSSAFNMIPQMGDKLATITDAQKSRGVETEGNMLTRMRAFLPIIGPVILSSISDVEEKTITLEVRGFTTKGEKTLLEHVEDTKKDQLIRKILWVVLIIMVIVRVMTWF